MGARTPLEQTSRARLPRAVGLGVGVVATVGALPLILYFGGLSFGHLHAVLDPAARAREFGVEYYVELGLGYSVIMLGGLVGCLSGFWSNWLRNRFVSMAIWLGLLILIALAGTGLLAGIL
jgi:hypothetical protein